MFFFISLRYEWKNRRAHFRMAGSPHTKCTSVFSFIPRGMNEKTDVHISVWRAPPYNVHVGFFIHTSRKRKKNEQSILKHIGNEKKKKKKNSFQIIFMQNLRENSFEMKRNINSSESARINLPMVMAEWAEW